MKTFSLSLLHWLSIVGCAAAQKAYIYNFDIQPQAASSSISSSIDSFTANAILARRLGATESTKLGGVDDTTLELLNRYGGQQPVSLFANQGEESIQNRLVIAIEGYDGEYLPASPSMMVERATYELAESSFLENLVCNIEHEKQRCTTYLLLGNRVHYTHIVDAKKGAYIAKDELSRMLGGIPEGTFQGNLKDVLAENLLNDRTKWSKTFLKLDMTHMTKPSRESRKAIIKDVFTTLCDTLQSLAEEYNLESTLLLLPSKRALSTVHLKSRQLQEEPLSQPFVSISPPSPSDSISASNSTTPLPPLGSFLPTCFPNLESCASATNNCSAHGTCTGSTGRPSCFACKCSSTIVRQDADGKNIKSIQWGGAACEKKDISVPFFLFAGFGVAMMAVVVGSIGLLYGMGKEELPGVIGAGVTGPRAQRQ